MQITPQNKRTNEDLAVAIQSGATELTEVLWSQVEDLVKWKADRYIAALKLQGCTRGIEFDDLLQTGFVALLEAIPTYKPDSGLFAPWFVIYIQKAFAEASGFRKKRDRCDPINANTSLDLPLSDDPEAAALHEILPDPEAEAALKAVEDKIWHEQLHEALENVLAELPEKSSTVLRLRYYQNQTLAAVGDVFNVGTEMARQLELQALRQLRKPRISRRLRSFYDYNVYSGTGLGAFKTTGMSVQERILIREEEKADRHS